MKSCLLIICLALVVFGGCDRFSVLKQLELYVAEQKKNSPLPRQISSQLSLVDIQVADHELIQVFKIKGPKGKIKNSTAELESQVLAALKKRKQEIKNLIDYKIVMTFKYRHAASGEELHEFQVEPWKELAD